MLKPKTLDISQTNIANLGSDLEKKVREAAAHGDPAWKECGKALGLQIWRIEKFTVKAWPKNQYGEFYSGDSYIVLHTYQKSPGAPFSYDVHFWLGDHTTQDEYGTAAYKTVELDDYLGGLPVQHRETQGNESKTFVSYFPHGIRILEGGVESGFRHVKPEEYRPRLLHVKGVGQNIRVQQTHLARDALNSGDVFILDKGLRVFQFNGAKSAGAERMKAAQVVRAIDDERGSKVEIIVTEEGSDKEAAWDEFWTALGGRGAIKTAEEGGADKGIQVTKRLFQLSDASGELKFTQVGEGAAVKRNLLNPNDVFILDDGGQIWAWVGKGSSPQEKAKALAYADMYLKKFNRPPLTPISRVLEGGENEQFEAAW